MCEQQRREREEKTRQSGGREDLPHYRNLDFFSVFILPIFIILFFLKKMSLSGYLV